MTTDLVEREGGAVQAVASEAAAFLQMIERVARDPTTDVSKFERLVAIQERIIDRQAEAAFNDAMVACQREMSPISADATNPQTRSKYATYAKLDGILRPIYTAHGISISFSTADSPKEEHVRVIAYASRGSYTRIYPADMPADGKGAKGGDVMTKTHATGAAMAYGRRYLLMGIFNIAVGEADVDGNSSGRIMAEGVRVDYENAIEALIDKASGEKLWQEIATACTKAGDIPTYDTLKKAMAAKMRGLK